MGSALFHQDLLTCPPRETDAQRPIALETGAPYFQVPACLEKALAEKVSFDEWTEYPPLHGLEALRESIAAFHRDALNIPHGAENILVTYGAMQGCFNYCTCELNPGDEVLLPAPYWFQFPHIMKYTQATLRTMQTRVEDGFKLTPELLERHITPRTKLLILTNPNNPTGSVHTPQELEALAEVLLKHPEVMVLSDEAYNLLVFKNQPYAGLAQIPELAHRVMVVNSLSKNFGLAGLRIGYIAGSREVTERLGQRQRFATLGVNPRLQHVAVQIMERREGLVSGLKAQIRERLDHARNMMRQLPLLTYTVPESGYYFFVNARPYLGRVTPKGLVLKDDEALADHLLKDAGVSVMPSSWCGTPGYLRLTFAVQPDVFEEAVVRMGACLRALQSGK